MVKIDGKERSIREREIVSAGRTLYNHEDRCTRNSIALALAMACLVIINQTATEQSKIKLKSMFKHPTKTLAEL